MNSLRFDGKYGDLDKVNLLIISFISFHYGGVKRLACSGHIIIAYS